ILLVREVRLNPSAVFHGHVNPAPAQTVAEAPVMASPEKHVQPQPAEPQPGIMDRLRNFYRKLTGRGPCAGSGCTS
ncbi:MAG: hypothetical protein LAO19_22445, partial [Acidobacteriia bacterium]|nr:hypothetical protein [Terriglobia bacterium]